MSKNQTLHLSGSELEAYVMGALEDLRAAEVERHVASCSSCEQRLQREARIELAFEQVALAEARAPKRIGPSRRRVAVVLRGALVGALSLAAGWLVVLGVPSAREVPSFSTQPTAECPAITSAEAGIELASDSSAARTTDGG